MCDLAYATLEHSKQTGTPEPDREPTCKPGEPSLNFTLDSTLSQWSWSRIRVETGERLGNRRTSLGATRSTDCSFSVRYFGLEAKIPLQYSIRLWMKARTRECATLIRKFRTVKVIRRNYGTACPRCFERRNQSYRTPRSSVQNGSRKPFKQSSTEFVRQLRLLLRLLSKVRVVSPISRIWSFLTTLLN